MTAGVKSDPAGFETLESFSKIPAFNRWLYGKIRKHVQGHTLEIGSGIGNISAFLLDDQPAVSLSDLREEYTSLLKNKFGNKPHLKGIYELDLSLPGLPESHPDLLGRFDTVIALNVVEHILDDSLAIRNAAALLRTSGKLIILVPAGNWLYNSLDRELGHHRRYTKESLNKLMESAGLTIIENSYFNAAAIAGWWFSGNVLREKIISPFKLRIYNLMVPLFRIADWFLSPFIGISVIAVGIKK